MVVGSLRVGFSLKQVELYKQNGPCLSKPGKIRVFEGTAQTYISGVREGGSVCLPKETKETVL